MADPLIPINAPSFILPIATPPPNPTYRAVRNLAAQTDYQIETVSQALIKQQQVKADREGFNEFYSRNIQLQDDIANIKDPVTRQSVYETGLNDAINNIHEQYPAMTPDMRSRLNMQSEMAMHRMRINDLATQEQINKRDAAGFIASATEVAKMARNKEERLEIYHNTIQGINEFTNAGLFTPNEAIALQQKFLYQTNKDNFQQLANEHPDIALDYQREETMLSEPDDHAIRVQAQSNIMRRHEIAGNIKRNEHDAAIADINAGVYKDDPSAVYEKLYSLGKIDLSEYRNATGFVEPTNPRESGLILNHIEEFPWTSKEEIEDYLNRQVSDNHYISPSDRASLMRVGHQIAKDYGNEQSKYARESMFNLQKYADSLIPAGPGGADPEVTRAINRELSAYRAQYPWAKSIADVTALHDNIAKRMYDIAHPTTAPVKPALGDLDPSNWQVPGTD